MIAALLGGRAALWAGAGAAALALGAWAYLQGQASVNEAFQRGYHTAFVELQAQLDAAERREQEAIGNAEQSTGDLGADLDRLRDHLGVQR